VQHALQTREGKRQNRPEVLPHQPQPKLCTNYKHILVLYVERVASLLIEELIVVFRFGLCDVIWCSRDLNFEVLS
jgi:hypothetical protein